MKTKLQYKVNTLENKAMAKFHYGSTERTAGYS